EAGLHGFSDRTLVVAAEGPSVSAAGFAPSPTIVRLTLKKPYRNLYRFPLTGKCQCTAGTLTEATRRFCGGKTACGQKHSPLRPWGQATGWSWRGAIPLARGCGPWQGISRGGVRDSPCLRLRVPRSLSRCAHPSP